MSFGLDLEEFQKKVEDKAEKIRRGATIDLFSSIMLGTPVDTGRLRGNWTISTPSREKEVFDEIDESGKTALDRSTKEAAKSTKDNPIYILNNVHYAAHVEKMDVGGMVRTNVARWEDIVSSVASTLK